MINAKVNLAHVHVEAEAKDDATLVAEAAVMFLGVARSIVENSDDAELAHFALARVAEDVTKRIKEGKFDDCGELEEETETEKRYEEETELDKAISTIVKKVLAGFKKDGEA